MGEHAVCISGWCAGGGAPGIVGWGGVLGCAVHVWGGFCGRGWCFEAGFWAGFWGVWRRGYSIRIGGLFLWGIVPIFV